MTSEPPAAPVSEERLEALRTRLVSLFRRRGSREPEDDAQETLTHAWVKLQSPDLQLSAPFEHYVYGIARYVGWESGRSKREIPVDPSEHLVQSQVSHEAVSADDRIFFRELLEMLPEQEGSLLAEYFESDAATVAAKSGVTTNAIRIRVHRASVKLRGLVDKGGSGVSTK